MTQEQVEETRNTLDRLRNLVDSADEGDKDALPEIRRLLDERPELAWHLVDLANVAEESLMKWGLGEDQSTVKKIIGRQVESMKREVAGENPSPLERLLAERVIATWVEVQIFEAYFFQNEGRLSIPQGEYHQKRLDRAHRRHLSAIRTLAQVRKLLKPTVAQVNIAEKQINLAGGELPGGPGQT
jgi:hypothetical protein